MEAAAAQPASPAAEIAAVYTEQWANDRRRLGCLEPDLVPHAATHIHEQIAMVRTLEERPHLRDRRRRLLRRVDVPRYAEFAGLDLDELATSGRVEHVEDKRHPADFALWKLTPAGRAAAAGVGLAVGPGLPRLAHRVLGHGDQVPGLAVRDPHRRRRPHPGAPHQRGGPERVGPRCAPVGADLDAQRVPRPGRREDLEVEGPRPGGGLARRARHRPAGLPLLLPAGPLPPAAGVHLGGDRGGGDRHRRLVGHAIAARAADGEPDAERVAPHLRRFWSALADDLNRATGAGRHVGCRARPRPQAADRWAFLADVDRALGFGLATVEDPDADQSGSDPRIDALVAEREAARVAKDYATSDRSATSSRPRASSSWTRRRARRGDAADQVLEAGQRRKRCRLHRERIAHRSEATAHLVDHLVDDADHVLHRVGRRGRAGVGRSSGGGVGVGVGCAVGVRGARGCAGARGAVAPQGRAAASLPAPELEPPVEPLVGSCRRCPRCSGARTPR